RGDPAPSLGLVDDVVVIERAGLHELTRDGAGDGLVGNRFGARTGGVGRAEREGGADALAAGVDQVGGDLGQRAVRAGNGDAQRSLDPREVAAERRELERLQSLHRRPPSRVTLPATARSESIGAPAVRMPAWASGLTEHVRRVL